MNLDTRWRSSRQASFNWSCDDNADDDDDDEGGDDVDDYDISDQRKDVDDDGFDQKQPQRNSGK